MMKGMKVACAAAALSIGPLGAANVARADQYQFTFTQSAYHYQSVGFFDLTGGVASNLTGNTYYYPGIDEQISKFSVADIQSPGSISHIDLISFASDGTHGVSALFDGDIVHVGNTYTGHSYETDFVASLFGPSSTPSSSGGAPSPEVDTLLGFAVVGATVAFLRRRRGADAEDAAA